MSERVTVYAKSAGGEDEYGDPVETWEPTVVEGALVYELAGSDLADADRPDGTRVTARVQLPDAAMRGIGCMKGMKVALTERGDGEDDALFVIGSPRYAPNLPTEWNVTVELGRTDG